METHGVGVERLARRKAQTAQSGRVRMHIVDDNILKTLLGLDIELLSEAVVQFPNLWHRHSLHDLNGHLVAYWLCGDENLAVCWR